MKFNNLLGIFPQEMPSFKKDDEYYDEISSFV
jgi:hypothetical protein